MLTIPKLTFPSKDSLPEFYEGKRSELLDRRNKALAVLKDSKGKTVASRAERHGARIELASVYDQADIEGLFIGQEEPCASARKDLDKMNEAMVNDFALARSALRKPRNTLA